MISITILKFNITIDIKISKNRNKLFLKMNNKK